MIPENIVLDKQNTDINQKRINFGSCVMVYIGTKKTMRISSVIDIALNDSDEWGGNNFMSLYSGEKRHSNEWEEVPMNEDVI